MRNKFDEQLKQLNNEMIEMANMIESAIQNAITAFLKQDVDTAKRIMNSDEIVDQKQKTIEGICFQLLIQQQPVARDLRTITAAMKMVTDMERIGDQTADIADISKYVTNFQFEVHPSIFKMGKVVSKMVNDSVNAFVRKEEKLARQVIDTDDEVDRLFEVVKRELVDDIRKNKDREQEGYELDILMVAKYLERIGDHAVNLGEWVVYSIQGNMF